MTIWLIEPRDPVIFRDGRPFTASPGARAKTLNFPLPATTAGATRTRAGRDANGHFDAGRIKELLGEQLRGPLLVELTENGGVKDWLFPAPADALILKHEPYNRGSGRLIPLTVVQTPTGTATNLGDSLALVGAAASAEGKPHSKAPAFWRWSWFAAWLLNPAQNDDAKLDSIGLAGPVRESRMHVSIASATQTAEDGALFQTAGLEFTSVPASPEDDPPPLADARRLALALQTGAGVKAGLDFLGGERRVVQWTTVDGDLPICPDDVRKRIKETGHCRLILLTPGLFAKGYLPTLDPQIIGGVEATVEAAAVNRYQTVSGWDYAHVNPTNQRRGRPKPTRRLAPAGSVYFLKLDGKDDSAIDSFINAVWMHNISDAPQDRLDGFGLAVLGVWDGVPQEMEVNDESQS